MPASFTNSDDSHRCLSPGCPERVARTKLTCAKHWHALPQELRDAVMQGYRNRSDKDNSEHMTAIAAALRHLRQTHTKE